MLKILYRLNVINRLILLVAVPILSILMISQQTLKIVLQQWMK